MKRIWLALLVAATFVGVAAGDPYTYHMTCYQGGDCRTTFRFTAAGKAVDLTGTTFSAQVRATYTTPAAMADFAIDSSAASQGMVTVALPATTLSPLAGKTGYWDLRLVDQQGSAQYMVRGQWKCLYSATR